MINLIPPHARTQVKIEYWIRVVSVWFLLLSLAFLIIMLLMVPSLVLIRSQLSAYENAYSIISDKNDIYSELEQKVEITNTVARTLATADTQPTFSEIISALEQAAEGKVTINALSTQRTEGVVESVVVSGRSYSRTSLVAFRDALESKELFDSAELPLSNLAKDKDVPFTLTVLISQPQSE